MGKHKASTVLLVLLAASLLGGGCVTPAATQSADSSGEPGQRPKPDCPAISLEQDYSTLKDTVRQVGRDIGGSLVLMNGIGEAALPPATLADAPFRSYVAELAAAAGCTYAELPHYYLIHPPGYETLTTFDLTPKVDARYHDMATAVALAEHTPLYSAFLLMGYGLGITIIGDNGVADSLCGEVALAQTPLVPALEAVLASARVAPNAIAVTSTPEFIFLATAGNDAPLDCYLGPEPAHEVLSKHLDLILPHPPQGEGQLPAYRRPFRLARVLSSLSAQIGMPVEVQAELRDFPVNPCAMKDVSLRTALNLLVRQWPLDRFGYECDGKRVYLRAR